MTPLLGFIVVMALVVATLFFVVGRVRIAPEWYSESRRGPRSLEEQRASRKTIKGTTRIYDTFGKPGFRFENSGTEPERMAISGTGGITVDRLDLLLEIQEFLQEAFPKAKVKRAPRASNDQTGAEDAEFRNLNPWPAEVFSIELRHFRTYHLALTDGFLQIETPSGVLQYLREREIVDALEKGGGEGCLWIGRSGIHARALQLGPFE